jgi:hypothetical protein
VRNLFILLLSVVGGAGLAAVSLNAATQPSRGPNSPGSRGEGCTVYQDANYQGRREFAPADDAADFVGEVWNDQVSSIRCTSRCRLTAYEHADFQGAQQTFSGEVVFVGPRWNDQISAWRVTCEDDRRFGNRPSRSRPVCTFYEHAQFAGRREDAGEGPVAFVGQAWNDQISSLECRPGCSVTVFVDANHAGPSQRFEGRVGFVGPFWNDKISAYRITCRR